ncbi:trypsin-like serine protease [Basidiobolus meristosporus CBS 931.73]|uniref:Trypsin-like serine protease n=1 Tax=Basidiobolus meristosporus CBS 931.73 TaxID=1314790 RepID=A0A1Y1XE98_9FUNG|nr:trypsin-like serine protease [Basidiobolus meristosporus CBS 931.73]|eukprot:ORX84055.1 trypsin-like serine protease [Basidiobolus meristosporus CBS 931.73]
MSTGIMEPSAPNEMSQTLYLGRTWQHSILGCKANHFIRPDSGIFGGTEVYPPFSYPWMAMILTRTSATQATLCGGTLIDRETILTAAHCVDMAASPDIVMIQLHRHNRSRTVREENGFVSGVKSIIIHPEWEREKLVNDYAILKLTSPAPHEPVITLDDGTMSVAGSNVRALGWGRIDEQRAADTLQQVNLQIFPHKNCERRLRGFDARYTLCAGTKDGGENICFGDSGGPLIQMNENGPPILVGVTSFTRNCEPDFPSGFARVAARKAWIEGHLTPRTSNSPLAREISES